MGLSCVSRLGKNRSSVRVLVVDGPHGIADLLVGILHMSGFDARVLYGIAEAIRFGEEFRPHVLISEEDISGMEGYELAATFAQRSPASRVRLLSCNVYQVASRQDNPPSLKVVQKFAHVDELFQFLDSL